MAWGKYREQEETRPLMCLCGDVDFSICASLSGAVDSLWDNPCSRCRTALAERNSMTEAYYGVVPRTRRVVSMWVFRLVLDQ